MFPSSFRFNDTDVHSSSSPSRLYFVSHRVMAVKASTLNKRALLRAPCLDQGWVVNVLNLTVHISSEPCVFTWVHSNGS